MKQLIFAFDEKVLDWQKSSQLGADLDLKWADS